MRLNAYSTKSSETIPLRPAATLRMSDTPETIKPEIAQHEQNLIYSSVISPMKLISIVVLVLRILIDHLFSIIARAADRGLPQAAYSNRFLGGFIQTVLCGTDSFY